MGTPPASASSVGLGSESGTPALYWWFSSKVKVEVINADPPFVESTIVLN